MESVPTFATTANAQHYLTHCKQGEGTLPRSMLERLKRSGARLRCWPVDGMIWLEEVQVQFRR